MLMRMFLSHCSNTVISRLSRSQLQPQLSSACGLFKYTETTKDITNCCEKVTFADYSLAAWLCG